MMSKERAFSEAIAAVLVAVTLGWVLGFAAGYRHGGWDHMPAHNRSEP